jgi:hypothetical protein
MVPARSICLSLWTWYLFYLVGVRVFSSWPSHLLDFPQLVERQKVGYIKIYPEGRTGSIFRDSRLNLQLDLFHLSASRALSGQYVCQHLAIRDVNYWSRQEVGGRRQEAGIVSEIRYLIVRTRAIHLKSENVPESV